MKNLVWYLFLGTRGGGTRSSIVIALKKQPQNAHQLAKGLKLDYKTIIHHLDILVANQMLSQVHKGKYGSVYFIGDYLEEHWRDFGEIWERTGKK